jgi:hypothetical protein
MCLLKLIAHPHESGPILLVVPHEIARAAPTALLEQLVRREHSVLDRVRVELELVARDRVHERADHFEERVDQERDVYDQRLGKAFWVVRLENVQGLDNTPAPNKTVSHSQALALAILMTMLTDFAIANDGFFALSAKLIMKMIDLFERG